MNNKLQTKDLINVGIFTAIYFVVFFICGCLGFIPILFVLVPFVCPLVAGIPFMLYLTKVKAFGMVTLTGLICGILMILTGHTWAPLITGVVFGLLSDLIMKSGSYKSRDKMILGYGVFSMWLSGMMVPLYIITDSYTESMISGYGQEYFDALTALTPAWTAPIFLVMAFVGGIIGALLGRAVLKKHFMKAGIA